MTNEYHPMTANEAGATFVKPDGMWKPGDTPGEYEPVTPSKPCTEGANDSGDHCFCVIRHREERGVGYTNRVCCWCESSAPPFTEQRVPGHGPYRTELVRE